MKHYCKKIMHNIYERSLFYIKLANVSVTASDAMWH